MNTEHIRCIVSKDKDGQDVFEYYTGDNELIPLDKLGEAMENCSSLTTVRYMTQDEIRDKYGDYNKA